MVVTLKHKLIISSCSMLILIGAVAGLGENMAGELAREQDLGAKTSAVASQAEEAAGIGASLYQIVADAVINRDLAATQKEWSEAKEAALKEIADLDSKLTSQTDIKLAKEGLDALNAFIVLFEQQSLPELIKVDSLALTQTVRDIDGKMDDAIAASTKAMKALAANQVAAAKERDQTFDATSHHYLTLMMVALGVGIIAALFNMTYLIYQISRPVNGMTESMRELASGNTKKEIPGTQRKDEIGGMANALLVFKENMIEADRLRAEQDGAKKRAEEDRKKMMHKLADDFESGVQGIINMVASASTELYHTAENMKTTVTTVSTESGSAASASQQTSGNVQGVASAVEEMSSSIREIASQVSKSSSIVNEAVARAAHADTTVHLLTEAVAQIGSISEMIQNIAGQINLLALNATIESARAGDAGKGFAVVASEVKSLATQTSKATDEIAKQIENVRNVSMEVVNSLKEIQGAVANVNQYSGGIAAAVEEQSAATGEISSNMQQAAKGVETITSSIGLITKGASDADAGAVEVLNAARMLSEQSETLNREVNSFLAGIRA